MPIASRSVILTQPAGDRDHRFGAALAAVTGWIVVAFVEPSESSVAWL
jgi:hypothetical protein